MDNKECGRCEGSGEVYAYRSGMLTPVICPRCHGSGCSAAFSEAEWEMTMANAPMGV